MQANTLKNIALAGGFALIANAPALAHTSYMLPSKFSASEGGPITVQSSFSDDMFNPEIPVTGADYHVQRPDGAREAFDTVLTLRQLVVLEDTLDMEGTYRFTSGVRLGRIGKRVLVDGEWKPLFEPDAEVPENATQIITTQTETVADVYVSNGAPNWTNARQSLGRLVFSPLNHPNEIYLDEGFEMSVQFDDTPLADHEMTVYRANGQYENPKYQQVVKTDADGELKLNFDTPGVYLVMTRHRASAPAGSITDERSYTTSLTFEVLR